MPSIPANIAWSRILTLATITLVIVALHLAQAILLPLALAILFSFLLAPLVTRLEHWGLSRIPAVIAVVGVAFICLASLIVVFSAQLVQVTYRLPEYKHTFQEKVRVLQSEMGPTLGMVSNSFSQLTEHLLHDDSAAESTDAIGEFSKSTNAPASQASTARGERPVPVEIVDTTTSPLTTLRDWLGPIVNPLAAAGIVTIFVIFMLIEREDLRNRAIVLLGEHKLGETTKFFDDASQRVSRYLRMQVLINVLYGAAVTVGLLLLQMPNAPLWGLLACLSRFVPFVGAWVSALLPTALSLVVFDGWGHTLAMIGMYVSLELIANNVLEPWLYGSSTGLSSVGIVLSAFFWTWLWGGVGLVLATPLTACLTAWSRYVPQLRFLNVLISDQPVLPPGARVYQRLLAFDFDEASDLVEEHQKTHNALQLCDEVLLPTLQLVELDRHDGALEPETQSFVLRSLRELVEDIPQRVDPQTIAGQSTIEVSDEPSVSRPAPRILCLPSRDDADEIAARMVCRLWRNLGHVAEVVPVAALVSERVDFAKSQDFDVLCISAVPPSAMLHARYMCKKLRPRFSHQKILVGLWNESGDLARAQKRLQVAGADEVVTTIAQAIDKLRQLASAAILIKGHRDVLAARSEESIDSRIAQAKQAKTLSQPENPETRSVSQLKTNPVSR